MHSCSYTHFSSLKLPHKTFVASSSSSRRELRIFSVAMEEERSNLIPTAPISLPEGSWKQQIAGGVTAAKRFKACGMYSGLRASGKKKPDLALLT